jgi:hypothetical protein
MYHVYLCMCIYVWVCASTACAHYEVNIPRYVYTYVACLIAQELVSTFMFIHAHILWWFCTGAGVNRLAYIHTNIHTRDCTSHIYLLFLFCTGARMYLCMMHTSMNAYKLFSFSAGASIYPPPANFGRQITKTNECVRNSHGGTHTSYNTYIYTYLTKNISHGLPISLAHIRLWGKWVFWEKLLLRQPHVSNWSKYMQGYFHARWEHWDANKCACVYACLYVCMYVCMYVLCTYLLAYSTCAYVHIDVCKPACTTSILFASIHFTLFLMSSYKQVIAVWRMCKASPNPDVRSMAMVLSRTFDGLFYSYVYLPMQPADKWGRPCMRPSEGTLCRVYDYENHEWVQYML